MLRYIDLNTNSLLVPAPPISAALPAGSIQPLVFATWPSPTLGQIKRGSTLTLQIQFIQNNTVIELSAGASGLLGFKPKDQHDATSYCAFAGSWVKTGSGTTAIYTFTVTFITAPLNNLFQLSVPTATIDSVDLIGEIKWTDSNGTHETQPDFAITILNDVNQGGESLPVTASTTQPAYLSSVIQLTGNLVVNGIAESLDAVPTVGVFVSRSAVILNINGAFSIWFFTPGAADGSDAGQVAPHDYNASTNNFHWAKGGGL